MKKPKRLSALRPSLAPPPSGGGALPQEPRGSARQRGYDAGWDRESRVFLKANPLCLGCKAVGILRPSAITDHIQPHKGNRRLFRDPANRQPSGRWHHDVVKQQLERRFDAGEIGAEDLRLDSDVAVALTRQLLARGDGPCDF